MPRSHGRLSAYFQGIGTPRTSSHLKRHSALGFTGGVDLCTDDDVEPPLAQSYRHLLYIAIVQDKRRSSCMFLKQENYSVPNFRGWAYHAVRYARSQVR